MHSDSPPAVSIDMTPQETYRFHVWLGAVKRCSVCNELKPVTEFGAYGVRSCTACRAAATSDELEDFWAGLKARVGVGAA